MTQLNLHSRKELSAHHRGRARLDLQQREPGLQSFLRRARKHGGVLQFLSCNDAINAITCAR
jgi:hypothetical protein